MLHPSRPGHDLCVLELVLADLAPRVIEDHAASARRTLVDCSDEVGHGLTLFLGRSARYSTLASQRAERAMRH